MKSNLKFCLNLKYRYFNQKDLLSKVPDLFYVLAIIYGSIGFIAICLIFNFEDNTTQINHIYCDLNESQTNLLSVDNNNETISIRLAAFSTNYSLRQALNTRYFYILWITFGLSTQSAYFNGSMIKAFGQSFIFDDHYLALILSLSFIFNGIGGIFWGKLLDFLRFRVRFFLEIISNQFFLT